jgi:hypothetical protein
LDAIAAGSAVVSARSSLLAAWPAPAAVCAVAPALRSAEAIAADPATIAFLGGLDRPAALVVFKSSHALEARAAERGWRLLAAPAHLARRWENKVAFLERARALGLPLPPACTVAGEPGAYDALARTLGPDLVVQAPHGYGGARTIAVADAAAFDTAVARLRAPRLRVATQVAGRPVTVNACVTSRGIAATAPFVQITGEPLLTPHRLGSCGNDWSAAPPDGAAAALSLVRVLGDALAGEGYRGVFGVDLVLTAEGSPVVIEVNPRLVASIALHAQLEAARGRLPLLARHIVAHLEPGADGAALDAHEAPLAGSQLILHNLEKVARRVSSGARSGVYRWDEAAEVLSFARPAARLADAGDGEVLVLVAPEDRPVRAGAEAGRIQRRTGAVGADGRLTPASATLARAARRLLFGPASGDS